MQCFTDFGKAIISTDPIGIKLDKAVKNILAYKPLLARIFKEVVSECNDMSYDEIVACIEGDILISEEYVDSGMSNSRERIEGLSTEAYNTSVRTPLPTHVGCGMNRFFVLS